jgi:magnesium-protoporphyrin O-methyltransferase
MNSTYETRRLELTRYFDRTAVEAWARLTSDAPVSRIRETVRAGRQQMRDQLLAWLPQDLSGKTIYDAGCGPGAFAIEAAARGAHVTAVDVSPTLIELASERLPEGLAGTVEFGVGDMLTAVQGPFDYVVAMDSLIHYAAGDKLEAITALAGLASEGLLLTFAPRTPALAVMHAVGRLLPRGQHRAPAIEPIAEQQLRQGIASTAALQPWQTARSGRVSVGFYVSQAMELLPR